MAGRSKSAESSVGARGETVIPAAIRKRHHIETGDQLIWLDDGKVIRVVPMPKDPLRALGGDAEEGLVQDLLDRRRRDQDG
ncbi:MAG: AbrB/MazE/SpoVT family DNA-binding domain-containing protein [Acidobacteria bacterium]|nr:AbrB/MazE/SpoVT family DNA-binding domain-containing protein [Acidobacteriota bacterium]